MLKKDYPKFTLRVSREMLYKLSYISEFDGKTKNKEIETILRKYINEFEKQFGIISVPDDIIDEDYMD